jgi:hypothetical protein
VSPPLDDHRVGLPADRAVAGTRLARRLSDKRGALTTVFAAGLFAVAAYMLWKTAAAL